MSGSGADRPPAVNESVLTATIEAYYPRALAVGDAARSRAQAGYAILSALAGTSVTGVLLQGGTTHSIPVRVLYCVAIVNWFAATVAYVSAVASPVVVDSFPPRNSTTESEQAANFVEAVLQEAKRERDRIQSRQAVGNRFALIALATSLLAIFISAFLPQDSGTGDVVDVHMSTADFTHLFPTCPPSTKLSGRLLSVDQASFVHLKVKLPCSPETNEIEVPDRMVTAIAIK